MLVTHIISSYHLGDLMSEFANGVAELVLNRVPIQIDRLHQRRRRQPRGSSPMTHLWHGPQSNPNKSAICKIYSLLDTTNKRDAKPTIISSERDRHSSNVLRPSGPVHFGREETRLWVDGTGQSWPRVYRRGSTQQMKFAH